MKRIVVIGVTGSGKTTLGRKLAEKAGAAFVDLDDLFWLPGWVKQPVDAFAALAAAATPADGNWVVAGNYSSVRDSIWDKADTLVWLDYPFPTVLFQLLRRTASRVFTQQSICNGNREDIRKTFSKDSILVWLFKSYGKHRRNYGELFGDTGRYPDMAYIRLCSPSETARFLSRFTPEG